MNISSQLSSPLNNFVVDVPARQYYDFELAPDSTYPLKGVTYPVDYGNVPGYTTEDGHELDLFVGSLPDGLVGYIVVDRGAGNPNEHKFYVGLTPVEIDEAKSQLKPVLVEHKSLKNVEALLGMIGQFKDK